MDCVKNLTACAGCTKKHAKCAWREVRGGELAATAGTGDDHEYRSAFERGSGEGGFRESRRNSDDTGSKMSEETRDNNPSWAKAEGEQKMENAGNARSEAPESAHLASVPAARGED